jgi:type VI secretion system protein ImpG
MIQIDKEQLAYYERELQYLRKTGADFARKHPKVAHALGLNPDDSSDPQVERLIESFAFLTSTLQRKYDEQFPQVSQNFLSVLYPQLVAPVPPMSIAEFSIDAHKGKSTTGQFIPRETELYINSDEGMACRFRTSYDLTLWPLSIEDVVVEPSATYDFHTQFSPYPYLLRINVKSLAKKLKEYEIKDLCFYINADHFIGNWLFECLFLKESCYAVLNPQNHEKVIIKSEEAIGRVGFRENESVLPEFPQSAPSFNLLQEYYALPQKFMFFRLNEIDLTRCDEEAVFLIPLVSYDDTLKKNLQISQNSIKLGCTPIINLFTHLTDPIDFNKRALSYPLIPNAQKHRYLEIHTVLDVFQTIRSSKEVKKISPYFSYNHQDIIEHQDYFYHAQIVDAPSMPGTNTELSFVNLGFQKNTPIHETIYARTLCSNRDLASFIRPGYKLSGLNPLPVSDISILQQPTPSIYNPGGGNYHWQLISQLTTDYVVLSSKDRLTAKNVVKEAVNVFRKQVSNTMMTDGSDIIDFTSKDIVRRVGKDAWRGFLNGMAYHITFSEASFSKKDVLLFSAVLDSYFRNFTYTVSFSELNIHKPNQTEIWKKWSIQEL